MLNYTAILGKQLERTILPPILKFLYFRFGLTPNKISILSFVIATMSVIFIFIGKMEIAFVFLGLALVFDVFDGAVARYFKLETKLGERLELIFDRANEAMLFFALAFVGLVSFKIATLAVVVILFMTLLRDKSKFDPGFKRIMLFVGYFFSNFQLALEIIFFANLVGFVISLLIIDYKHQVTIDSQGLKL